MKYKRYNNDIKKASLKLHDSCNNARHVSNIFDMPKSTLYSWLKKNKSGKLFDKYVRTSIYSPQVKLTISENVLLNNQVNLEEIKKLIKEKYNFVPSKTKIYQILNEMNITRKKIRKLSTSKDRKKLKKLTTIFRRNVGRIKQNKIISIDEVSFDTHMTNDYAWSKIGTRIELKHDNTRIRFTAICAVSNKQIIHIKLIRGSAKSNDFLEFIKELIAKLGNKLYYLLLDNARIHNCKLIINHILTTKYKLIFNPPYSPQYNPIERVFSKVKCLLRKMDNRIPEKLCDNVTKCFNLITESDLISFFNYSLEIKLFPKRNNVIENVVEIKIG